MGYIKELAHYRPEARQEVGRGHPEEDYGAGDELIMEDRYVNDAVSHVPVYANKRQNQELQNQLLETVDIDRLYCSEVKRQPGQPHLDRELLQFPTFKPDKLREKVGVVQEVNREVRLPIGVVLNASTVNQDYDICFWLNSSISLLSSPTRLLLNVGVKNRQNS